MSIRKVLFLILLAIFRPSASAATVRSGIYDVEIEMTVFYWHCADRYDCRTFDLGFHVISWA